MSEVAATFCTILWGYLLLPAAFWIDFPLIPPLDKDSISALSALLLLRLVKNKKIRLVPEARVEKWLIFFLMLIPFATVVGNTVPIVKPDGSVLPGLTYHDALSDAFGIYIRLIPFIIAFQIVRSYDDQLVVFKLLLVASLMYTLPILFEIRLSPQLHIWTYGFFPHDWRQMVRGDGFRPVVFLGHGLLVSMFLVTGLVAAMATLKVNMKIVPVSNVLLIMYLFFVLVISKSLAGILMGISAILIIGLTQSRTASKVSLALAFLFLLHPLLVTQDLFPHQQLVELAAKLDVDRAASLQFRFTQEVELVERALEKKFFGWGGWNRNNLSGLITDSFWIIRFGQAGFLGFGAMALLFWLVVWRSYVAIKKSADRKVNVLLSSHLLVVSLILIDQLVNSSMYAVSWFLIGALAGRCVGLHNELSVESKQDVMQFNEARETEQSQTAKRSLRNKSY